MCGMLNVCVWVCVCACIDVFVLFQWKGGGF